MACCPCRRALEASPGGLYHMDCDPDSYFEHFKSSKALLNGINVSQQAWLQLRFSLYNQGICF